MLRMPGTSRSGRSRYPQCCVIQRCAAGVVVHTLGWEEVRERLARGGSQSQQSPEILGAREFSGLLPPLPRHFTYSQ